MPEPKTARGQVLQLGTPFDDKIEPPMVGVVIRMLVEEARKLGLYTLVDIRPAPKGDHGTRPGK